MNSQLETGTTPPSQTSHKLTEATPRPATKAVLLVLAILSLLFQIYSIRFGLPGPYPGGSGETIYWFNDEIKEVEHIKSYLAPKATLLHFNYPPGQYLLAAGLLAPQRIISGELPSDATIALTSRLISSLSVAIAVVVIGLIAAHFSSYAAILSASLLAVSPIIVMMGRDTKSTALGGLFLLLAIYFSFREFSDPTLKKNYRWIGLFLALSTLCSHLALAYILLPVVTLLFSVKKEHLNSPVLVREPAITSGLKAGTVMLFLSSLAACVFVSLWYLLQFHESNVLVLARRLYDGQQHALPFEQHLPLILDYLGQLKTGIFAAVVASLLMVAYLGFRQRFASAKCVQWLAPLESAYSIYFLTVLGILVLATVLNPLIPFSMLNFVNSGFSYMGAKAGYYGLYPGDVSAESFFLSIFPSSVGWPLYSLSVVSLIGLIILKHTQRKRVFFILCIFAPFFLQLLTWNSTFRASRFGFTFFFLLFLTPGIFLTILWYDNRRIFRVLSLFAGVSVVICSLLFSWAYTKSRDYAADGRVRAAEWLIQNVPAGTSVGVASIAELPRNLGPASSLRQFTYTTFEDFPEYCIMDGFEEKVMRTYFLRTADGYTYSTSDWWPSRVPPGLETMTAYDAILGGRDYELMKVISSSVPKVLGLSFDMRLLFDPAEYYHREFFVFRKKILLPSRNSSYR